MAALDFVQVNNDMHMNEACTSQSPCVFIILATYIQYRTGGGQTVKMTLRWLYIILVHVDHVSTQWICGANAM